MDVFTFRSGLKDDSGQTSGHCYRRSLAPIAACLCLSLVSLALTAQATPQGYYHWVDENGQMHFSQTPPLDAPPVEFIPAAKKNFTDAAYKEELDSGFEDEFAAEGFDDSFDKNFDEGFEDDFSEKENAVAKAEPTDVGDPMEILPQKNEATCKAAQYNLQQLSPQGGQKVRVRISTPSGEPRLLREEEIQAQRDKANRLIDLHC